MRRGFNLFSVFVGISMIAIAVAFSVYVSKYQINTEKTIAPKIFGYETASVADFVRDDATATLTNRIRQEFQEFFATQVLWPPQESYYNNAYQNEDVFKNWFENRLAKTNVFTSWFAHRLALELQKYQNLRVGDYAISISANEEQMQKAIADGSTFKILNDGTFVYILDTTKISDDEYRSLPRLVLRKGFSQVEFPVLPRQKWAIRVPIRVMKAYDKARKVWQTLQWETSPLMLAAGACRADCPVCGVYSYSAYGFRMIWPKDERYSKECFLTTEKDVPEEGKYKPVVVGSVENVCMNQYLDLNSKEALSALGLEDAKDVPKKIVCFSGTLLENYQADQKAALLAAILNERLKAIKKQQRWDVNMYVDPSSFRMYKTERVCKQRVISLASFVSSQLPGMDWLLKKIGSALGLDILAQGTIGLSPCEEVGYLTCTAPTNFGVVVHWEDKDKRYRTLNEPASFNFGVRLTAPFLPMAHELNSVQREVNALPKITPKKYSVTEDTAKKLDKKCVENTMASCMVQYLKTLADCNDVKNPQEVNEALNKYYENPGDHPLLKACDLPWPSTPSVCVWKKINVAVSLPTFLFNAIPPLSAKNWTESKVASEYFGSFAPGVLHYVEEKNEAIQTGKVQSTKECNTDLLLLRSMYGGNGACGSWDRMKEACSSLSLKGKSWYKACPKSKYTAYSTFWVHIFAEPVGTCSAGEQRLTEK